MAGQSKLRKSTVKQKCILCGAEVQNLYRHHRDTHVFTTTCIFCTRTMSHCSGLLCHLKDVHGHMIGYLLPVSSVVEEKKALQNPVNMTAIRDEIERLKISSRGGTWIENDEFFVSFDMTEMRPLVVVEIVTPESLKGLYKDARDELPYLQDPELPKTQCHVGDIIKSSKNVAHLASCANHRLSQEQNDTTFLLRNLVRLNACVNQGILQSTESHLNLLGTNWWKSVLVSVPVYDRSTTPGQLPEPSHVGKMMVLGDHQVQCYIVTNDPQLDPSAANFAAMRAGLLEFNELTHLNFHTDLPMSWEVPKWKCLQCRFLTDDDVDLKLHERFEHKNRFCPIHRKNHGDEYPTYAQYKQHVEAGGRKYCQEKGCGSWFYNNADLHSHVKAVHVTATFQCTFEGCPKMFKTEKQLSVHLATHQDNRVKLPCPHCDHHFVNKGKLQQHIKEHHRQATAGSPNRITSRRAIATSTQSEDDPTLEEQIAAQDQVNGQLSQVVAQQAAVIAQQSQEIASLQEQVRQLTRKAPGHPSRSPKRRRGK